MQDCQNKYRVSEKLPFSVAAHRDGGLPTHCCRNFTAGPTTAQAELQSVARDLNDRSTPNLAEVANRTFNRLRPWQILSESIVSSASLGVV
jgi:hypothetical protein